MEYISNSRNSLNGSETGNDGELQNGSYLVDCDRENRAHMSEKERLERCVQLSNELSGDLNEVDGYDCRKCNNKGVIFRLVEERKEGGEPTYREESCTCHCMKIRSSIRRMKRSGLEATIRRCMFDKFDAAEEWQKTIKDAAMRFADNVDKLENKWFFIGGGIGCGKTHLCTAIARELLYKGYEVRYMLWVDDSANLKACVNDAAEYYHRVEELKKVPVLYIDDFFKVTRDAMGRELFPSAADVKLAYEIINHRYQNPKLITILSSERFVSEIEAIDSAVGSRIYEKTKGNAYNVAREPGRNYRMKEDCTV